MATVAMVAVAAATVAEVVVAAAVAMAVTVPAVATMAGIGFNVGSGDDDSSDDSNGNGDGDVDSGNDDSNSKGGGAATGIAAKKKQSTKSCSRKSGDGGQCSPCLNPSSLLSSARSIQALNPHMIKRRERKDHANMGATAIGEGFGMGRRAAVGGNVRRCAARSGMVTATCSSSPLMVVIIGG